ncbi:Hpt domain-containing protein [Polaribacter sp.]|uniref:Hpt domain-containing protein n=1 Tax=Polaribacter sp. TaxID=1920175 RepID=UPI004048D11D
MTPNNEIKSNIVDLKFLNENFGQDYDSYSQMIVYFLDQSDEKVQQLKDSVQSSDFINIKAAAHFLKSSFNVMGLKSTPYLIEMEHLSIQQSNIEKISELLNEVVLDFDQSVVEYKRILSIVTELK